MIEGIEASGVLQQADDIEQARPEREIVTEGEGQQSFSDVLSDAINGVDQTMKTSEAKVEDVVAGRSNNVHDAMISMQRAKLSFDLMVEVRNKVVETYQEVSRMQI
jgi:flagellar hook-basal body complex protein FliE